MRGMNRASSALAKWGQETLSIPLNAGLI